MRGGHKTPGPKAVNPALGQVTKVLHFGANLQHRRPYLRPYARRPDNSLYLGNYRR